MFFIVKLFPMYLWIFINKCLMEKLVTVYLAPLPQFPSEWKLWKNMVNILRAKCFFFLTWIYRWYEIRIKISRTNFFINLIWSFINYSNLIPFKVLLLPSYDFFPIAPPLLEVHEASPQMCRILLLWGETWAWGVKKAAETKSGA